MKEYISLDIETTGFDGAKDQVIEIAAIKFNQDGIIDKFNQLVNPQIKIPPMITHITGIKEEDLTDSPTFDQISPDLTKFVGSCPIIGHNISFDINFLNQKGQGLINPLYDTLQLASIIIPGLPSYSLDTITRTLKIEHKERHRAYDDAYACLLLFNLCKEKISRLDENTLASIREIILKSELAFGELFTSDPEYKKSPAEPNNENLHSIEELTKLAETDYLGFYDEGGALSKVIPHYEVRPTQQKMSALILSAYEQDKHLLIEAGTGTGKTMAYLLPSIYFSLREKRQVIISTHTKNLQEQIIDKDVPLIKAALKTIDPSLDFNTALLKGRRNYLSAKRFELFLQKEKFEEHEAVAAIKILIWINSTQTGDFEELSLLNKEFNVLDDVCCAEYVCPHDDPTYSRHCYLLKARQKAESANILVVNHALLLQDSFSDKPLLPEPKSEYLIIDEAHHLERVATESRTITISFHAFLKPFERLERNIVEFQRQPTDLFNQPSRQKEIEDIKIAVQQIISRVEIFFGLMGIFLEKNLDAYKMQYQLLLKDHHLDDVDWQKIKDSAKTTMQLGKECLTSLVDFLETEENDQPVVKQILNYVRESEKRLKDLENIFQTQDIANQIIWLFKTGEGSVTLKSAPHSVAQSIRDALIKTHRSTILTSATLRTNQNFDFIRSQLGLDEPFDEHVIPSHFDFPEQVKILIPDDLPNPNSEGYFMQCANLIKQLTERNGGRMLVLFTSKKALTSTYMEIAPELKEKGYAVLAQGITGSRGKILENFKDEPEKCVIFGTDSFWEGVDLKGNMLTCVVMQKLPFDPPMDPIIEARCTRYMDSFNEYQVPRAILKFKQGFGRLIRSRRDTGSIVILDTRILQKEYGHMFLRSLPEGIQVQSDHSSQIPGLL